MPLVLGDRLCSCILTLQRQPTVGAALRLLEVFAMPNKRSASRSSDQEVMRHLSRSQIFKDYERAFSAATGLPLNIRGRHSWSPVRHGKENDHDRSLASILARFNKARAA